MAGSQWAPELTLQVSNGGIQPVQPGPGCRAGIDPLQLLPDGGEEGTSPLEVIQKQDHTVVTHLTVDAMAPRPARYRHLVLLAAGVTALSAEPWGTGAAARVWVTVALGTLAAPAALLREPPVARGTLEALGSCGPWLAVTLTSLRVALGALGGWSTGTRAAALALLKAEVSFQTAVTTLSGHARLAQAAPTLGITGFCPARGTVTPGAVAWQQSIAIEARGAAFTVGPSGVAEAASTSACQGVAVTEDHVGVSVTAAVAGLTGAAQHQRVSEKARCTPLTGGAGIAWPAEALGSAISYDATVCKIIGGHCQGARAAHTGRGRVTGVTADEAGPAALTLVPFSVVLAAHTDARGRKAAI